MRHFCGAALPAEYEDVLGRSALFRSGRLSAGEREELLDILLAHRGDASPLSEGYACTSALTVRLSDDKYEHPKEMARQRGTSVNRRMDEMAALLLAEFDAETPIPAAQRARS